MTASDHAKFPFNIVLLGQKQRPHKDNAVFVAFEGDFVSFQGYDYTFRYFLIASAEEAKPITNPATRMMR